MLTFNELREKNLSRAERWHKGSINDWSTLEWAGAMAGEAGEAANIAKKLKRADQNISNRGVAPDPIARPTLVSELAEELADTLLYIDLVAAREGINLEAAVRSKFNSVSLELGFPELV